MPSRYINSLPSLLRSDSGKKVWKTSIKELSVSNVLFIVATILQLIRGNRIVGDQLPTHNYIQLLRNKAKQKTVQFFTRLYKAYVKLLKTALFLSGLYLSGLYEAFINLLLVPILLFIRVIKPLLWIRFGLLDGSEPSHVELYLTCDRDSSYLRRHKRIVNVFHFTSHGNSQLEKMWHRTLCTSQLSYYLYRVNSKLPRSSHHTIPVPSSKEVSRLLVNTPPHLCFTSQEKALGFQMLASLDISPGQFVCFDTRNPASLYPKYSTLETLCVRSNYDAGSLDSDQYIAAAEEMMKRGYSVVWIGSRPSRGNLIKNPGLIHYTESIQSDFLDVFLAANCEFFLCSDRRNDAIPKIFRRPIVYVNLLPTSIEDYWFSPNSLLLFQSLWQLDKRSALTQSEILDIGLRDDSFIGKKSEDDVNEKLTYEKLSKLGIKLMANTSEEISRAVVEMDERLKGTWTDTSMPQEEMQYRLRSINKYLAYLTKSQGVRVSADFLSNHQEWLSS